MKRFIEGVDRDQATLFPERLDDYVRDDNPVRAVDAFVDALDLSALGFLEAYTSNISGRTHSLTPLCAAYSQAIPYLPSIMPDHIAGISPIFS